MSTRAAVILSLLVAVPAAAQTRFTWIDLGLTSAQSPPARFGHRMVYDDARGVALLFGGQDPSTATYFDDTWTFDGQTWTQHRPANRPPARHTHAMAYDPIRGRAVVAGGIGAGGALEDTWEWNGTDWALADPSTPGVGSHACYHPLLSGVFCSNLSGHLLWDGRIWTRLNVTQNRFVDNAIVFDPSTRKVLCWYASQVYTFSLPDGWRPVGDAWTGARNSTVAYSGTHQLAVLFGDLHHNYPSQTFWWNGQTWQTANPLELPRRDQSALVYDRRRDVFVMYGGLNLHDGSPLGDTQELMITEHPASFETYGRGCGGMTGLAPTLSVDTRWSRAPLLGGLFFTIINGAPPGQPVFGIVGGSRSRWGPTALPFPLDALGMPGCELLTAVNIVESPGAAGLDGTRSWVLPVPSDQQLLGAVFYQQAAVLAPAANAAGLVWTNGGAGTIGLR